MRADPAQVAPVVLVAPSGAGKTTIARALVQGEEDFVFSLSATTRAPREGEKNGEDYLFVSDSEFREMVARGEFAEWAEVHGELYGTPKESLIRERSAGRHVVLDIDVQGARQIREAVPEALLLFILPPSVEVLFGRLLGRGSEGEKAIRRRLTTALWELEAAEDFDFFVINDDLQGAVSEVRALVRSSRPPPGRGLGGVEDVRKLRREVAALLERERLLESP
jgi:guanylate kinase